MIRSLTLPLSIHSSSTLSLGSSSFSSSTPCPPTGRSVSSFSSVKVTVHLPAAGTAPAATPSVGRTGGAASPGPPGSAGCPAPPPRTPPPRTPGRCRAGPRLSPTRCASGPHAPSAPPPTPPARRRTGRASPATGRELPGWCSSLDLLSWTEPVEPERRPAPRRERLRLIGADRHPLVAGAVAVDLLPRTVGVGADPHEQVVRRRTDHRTVRGRVHQRRRQAPDPQPSGAVLRYRPNHHPLGVVAGEVEAEHLLRPGPVLRLRDPLEHSDRTVVPVVGGGQDHPFAERSRLLRGHLVPDPMPVQVPEQWQVLRQPGPDHHPLQLRAPRPAALLLRSRSPRLQLEVQHLGPVRWLGFLDEPVLRPGQRLTTDQRQLVDGHRQPLLDRAAFPEQRHPAAAFLFHDRETVVVVGVAGVDDRPVRQLVAVELVGDPQPDAGPERDLHVVEHPDRSIRATERPLRTDDCDVPEPPRELGDRLAHVHRHRLHLEPAVTELLGDGGGGETVAVVGVVPAVVGGVVAERVALLEPVRGVPGVGDDTPDRERLHLFDRGDPVPGSWTGVTVDLTFLTHSEFSVLDLSCSSGTNAVPRRPCRACVDSRGR